MFINSKELKSFMKENHLPDFEDLPKPLEETDDGFFMLPMDSMDIRDALPFDDVSWDKAKEGVKWNSTGITRDKNGFMTNGRFGHQRALHHAKSKRIGKSPLPQRFP